MGLQQGFLQIQPELGSPRRRRGQRRKRLFDAVLGGRTQLQPMVRHKMEQPQQHLRILQSRGLLQKYEPVHHGEIRRREP